MELAIAGGATGFFASATTAGTSMSWNPIGWIILAAVAIAAIWYFWDDICDFFSTVGNAIADAAKVIWEYVAAPAIPVRPPAIDEELPAPAPPIEVPVEKPITVPIAPTISVPTTKPRIKRREKNIYNVYDLRAGRTDFFRNYTFGMGFVDVMLLNGAIWKYGLTSFKSVYARYMVISQLYKSDKEEYIFDQLTRGKLVPFQWHLANATYAAANTKEVQLIDAYTAQHGSLPPGNTFRG